MVANQETKGQAASVLREVKDGSRTLKFDGELIATSSSKRPGVHRWVEFGLYRTAAGSYVLSRTGMSSLYHDGACAVVARNDLKVGVPAPDAIPCDECDPTPDENTCVERPRHWAQISDSPDAVLEALHKYDSDGTRYLTLVARKLIEQAATVDGGINEAYTVEHVR